MQMIQGFGIVQRGAAVSFRRQRGRVFKLSEGRADRNVSAGHGIAARRRVDSVAIVVFYRERVELIARIRLGRQRQRRSGEGEAFSVICRISLARINGAVSDVVRYFRADRCGAVIRRYDGDIGPMRDIEVIIESRPPGTGIAVRTEIDDDISRLLCGDRMFVSESVRIPGRDRMLQVDAGNFDLAPRRTVGKKNILFNTFGASGVGKEFLVILNIGRCPIRADQIIVFVLKLLIARRDVKVVP